MELEGQSGRWIEWKIAAACLILALFSCLVSDRVLAAGYAERFCREEVAREVSPPLKGMRKLPTPPYGSRRLPFGPPNLEILSVGLSQVSVEGGRIGFYLDARSGDPLVLNQRVNSRLSIVDRRGRVLRVLRQRVRQVGTAASDSLVRLSFNVGKSPRMYRVDFSARPLGGGRKAHYADYFRVVPREVAVGLSTSASQYRPGDDVLMHLENLGTVAVGYGYEFSLDYWNGGAWEESAISLPLWPQVALGLGGGLIQGCQRLTLPFDAAPGAYRLTKRFNVSPGERYVHVARARFSIAA